MMIPKFRRNAKALSPIFATLILIAIAVIAGIIVYMFTSGMLAGYLGGGSTAGEKVSIQAVQATSTTAITVWAKSQSGGTVSITSAIIKDAAGNVDQVVDLSGAPIGLTADLSSTGDSITVAALNTGDAYTVTLVSSAGNQFVSPSFTVP